MGKWVHRLLAVDDELVLCQNCGWVKRATDRGRPKCWVARESHRGGRGIARKLHDSLRGAECELCGSTDGLAVDHNHDCCPGRFGCMECIRGTLCRNCNLAVAAIERAHKNGTLEAIVAWAARRPRFVA